LALPKHAEALNLIFFTKGSRNIVETVGVHTRNSLLILFKGALKNHSSRDTNPLRETADAASGVQYTCKKL
jgi:hypothetical protein